MTATAHRGNHAKLHELRLLLDYWRGGLWIFLLVALGIVVLTVSMLGTRDGSGNWTLNQSDNSLGFVAAVAGAMVAISGHLLTKYADFKAEYIKVNNSIIDHDDLVNKRLVAFHAEIEENLSILFKAYSPQWRKEFIKRKRAKPDGKSFSRSDTSNPIFDENRPHLYEFGGAVIARIINYYNLETNLNLAVEALLMEEFHSLRPEQKLQWYFYMLDLVNDVADAGQLALDEISAEAGMQAANMAGKYGWQRVSNDELGEFHKEIATRTARIARQSAGSDQS